MHQTISETYGGRNNKGKQAKDASNPIAAVQSNVNKLRPALLKEGYLDKEIDDAIKRLSKPFETKKR